MRVVVTDQAFGGVDHERAAALAAHAEFAEHQCRSEDETLVAVRDANVVFNNFAPMNERTMGAMAEGATIIRYGVGVDNVDIDAAKRLGVHVCNVPDYGVEEVADHAAAMALTLARKLGRYDAGIRAGEWKIGAMVDHVRSLSQTTVGLIGFGRIARAFADRMTGFGAEIIAYDPYVSAEDGKAAGALMQPLDDVIAKADILSLHVPLTNETRHMVGEAQLARMRKGSILINVSRGGLVDEDALARALEEGHISGAGLDVFEIEPLPDSSPLRTAPNTIFTPHAAFFSEASVDRLQRLAAEEGLRALRGEPLRCALT
ncbi:MAG: dihydrofolate reductase [Rhizobiales bacterium]|nr:dihydrofolate reductase [Hyphomicrobiales bacterium]MBA70814.1 dihydrofolate reductase [Hyphomicrobiales bacterium]|tara:strand:- start:2085 stop:3035 length:951 start_codon:yes stop_codon:yes gene_type:complete